VHVLWQDYQFYLAPALVRAAASPATLARTVFQHFVHVPFPGPEAWSALPGEVLRELLSGLLGNDLIGFQLPGYADNFVRCCRAFLGLPADPDRGVVELPDGRRVRVASYPIPVSVEHLRGAAASPVTQRHAAALRRLAGGRQIVYRTERVDPVKAFPDALRAFADLLARPGMAGAVLYVAQLVPARASIPDWVALRRECERLAGEINARYGDRPRPVELVVRRDFDRAVAGYLEYDVLDVVPRADGMNLVALEGPVLNRRDGVVVLASTAGAHQVLRPHALAVHPAGDGSVRRHADALHRAVTMTAAERAGRARGLRAVAAAGDPSEWLLRQVEDAARTRTEPVAVR
jgi:trehalose 6-phosphate synthase